MRGLRIGVLVSGSGTNLQSIIDATKDKVLASEIVCVIANRAEAYGLVRARENMIDAIFIDGKDANYHQYLLETLEDYQVDLVVLAGYLKIIDETMIRKYKGRIINIHPSLLPKYGGKGYYGLNVHKAVLENRETVTGATVHFVDEGIDTGKIIIQKTVPVYPLDTPLSLQKRVLTTVEHKILVEAIGILERGNLSGE